MITRLEEIPVTKESSNSSVLPVHPRMPLILERGQWKNWLFDGGEVENLLAFRPQPLERFQEYEQQTLNF